MLAYGRDPIKRKAPKVRYADKNKKSPLKPKKKKKPKKKVDEDKLDD
jgi:hypothetical protein